MVTVKAWNVSTSGATAIEVAWSLLKSGGVVRVLGSPAAISSQQLEFCYGWATLHCANASLRYHLAPGLPRSAYTLAGSVLSPSMDAGVGRRRTCNTLRPACFRTTTHYQTSGKMSHAQGTMTIRMMKRKGCPGVMNRSSSLPDLVVLLWPFRGSSSLLLLIIHGPRISSTSGGSTL